MDSKSVHFFFLNQIQQIFAHGPPAVRSVCTLRKAGVRTQLRGTGQQRTWLSLSNTLPGNQQQEVNSSQSQDLGRGGGVRVLPRQCVNLGRRSF